MNQATDDGAQALHDWVQRVCADLDLDPAWVNLGELLELARDVAHGVARPAAPVTAFLLGLALGQAAPPAAPGAHSADLIDRIRRLLTAERPEPGQV